LDAGYQSVPVGCYQQGGGGVVRCVGVCLLCVCCGCSNGIPPVDLAGIRLIVLCGFNCPISATLADEGTATDTVPLQPVHLQSDNVRSLNETIVKTRTQ